MFEKDYLMRLFTDFMNSINRILNSIDKKDIDGAKEQINYNYKLLGNDLDFFLKTDINDLVENFKEKDESYLNRVLMLAELLYCDSMTNDSLEIRKNMLNKSILLFDLYTNKTKEFSFALLHKINRFKNELKAL